ncbi:MAG TPA: hypothetical protein VGN57_08750 [Pirellulaceae bacterium]|jgi:hypothetical protein|nr:hypothetical protein [Pirellulaceae bacterium]
MSVVYPAETVTLLFATQDPWSGEAIAADALPTGTLVRGGVATAVSVSIASLATGLYRATAVLPVDAVAGEWWELSIAATVAGIPAKAALKIGRSEARRIEPFFDASGRVDVGRLLGGAVALSAANRLQVDLREIVGSESAAVDLAAGAPRLDAAVSSRSSHAPADVRTAIDASSTKIAEILAGVATLTNEPMPEIASAADTPPEPTLRQALMLVYMWLRNDSRASATLRRIVDAAGAPVLEADLADDGTTFSQGTFRSIS